MNMNKDTHQLLGENLDALTKEDLALIGFNPIGVKPVTLAKKLFPDNPKGRLQATRALHNYAANKATAMICREHGEIETALRYEGICERIYAGLPEFAKW